MPNSRSSLIGQLLDLREVTRLTGTLEELQIHQLQMWGKLAFPGAKFGLNWDGEKRTVEYDALTPGSSRSAQEHDAYLEALNTSVKEMLGQEWLLTVKERGRTIYVGPRKLSFKPAQVEPLAPPRGDPDVK